MNSFAKRLRFGLYAVRNRIREALGKTFGEMACRFWIFRVLYYTILSPTFDREQRAVLAGMKKYNQVRNQPAIGFALLRRNTHRLEKGLLMRPRKPVFAKEYIMETVECYCGVVSNSQGTTLSEELRWARDVLQEFFRATGKDPILDSARKMFESTPVLSNCNGDCVPYLRRPDQISSISIDEFEKLCHYRRSVRWFLDKKVDRNSIDRAIQVALQSPSACNRQPFEFRIYDDPELVSRISEIPMGTAGYAQSIPVFIVIVGQQRNFFSDRDRHLIYIDSALAAMSFVFAAEVQGLATCCINWPDIEEKERELAATIGLAEDERPIMCMALGFPDPEGLVAYSQKKELHRVRFYNEVRRQC